jgi:hypothetical protein
VIAGFKNLWFETSLLNADLKVPKQLSDPCPYSSSVREMRKTPLVANWSPLRDALASVDDQVIFTWDELDALVGGLPRSAYEHGAFWKGDRTGWRGFTTQNVRVGKSVTFVRRPVATPTADRTKPPVAAHRTTTSAATRDLLLIGCVRRKVGHPAPARDLYISALFRKERDYAIRSGLPWFVLSAKHGLVAPSTVLAPYDLRLSKTSRHYRREWGERVLIQLRENTGPLAGRAIEIHAGAAYIDAIRDLLHADGAVVIEPLQGLTMGQRLAWYGDAGQIRAASPAPAAPPDVRDLVDRLRNNASAKTPAEILASRDSQLKSPGLYSWWVDQAGAVDLQAGLDQPLAAGLIYAGLAGATRSRSGRASTNTLWGRIVGMHLGGRHDFSTFRLSLGSVLANARRAAEIDEHQLSAWMHQHLRVVTIPVDDADTLNALESEILQQLDPPLNLHKVDKNPLRQQLSELRTQYGRANASTALKRERHE